MLFFPAGVALSSCAALVFDMDDMGGAYAIDEASGGARGEKDGEREARADAGWAAEGEGWAARGTWWSSTTLQNTGRGDDLFAISSNGVVSSRTDSPVQC